MRLEAIDHVQLAMPRGGEAAARDFYGILLGIPERPKPAELAANGGCWFEADELKIHLGVEEPFRPARKAHVAFRVDDVAKLAFLAREKGFEVIEDSRLEDHVRIFLDDPFGNRLEFLRPHSDTSRMEKVET